MNYLSKGTIRYSPKLLGERRSENWWVVVDSDEQIGRYYRHLYWLDRWKTDEMSRPAWDAHITVIRDEEPPHKEFWEKYAGQEVEFEVTGSVETNGSYYWLPVRCSRLLDLREELGLPRDPDIPLHLSIGHV